MDDLLLSEKNDFHGALLVIINTLQIEGFVLRVERKRLDNVGISERFKVSNSAVKLAAILTSRNKKNKLMVQNTYQAQNFHFSVQFLQFVVFSLYF